MVGMKAAWTGGDFGRVLMQYDDLAGAASNNIEARIREPMKTASTRSWRSPTRFWRCSTTRTSRCASGVPDLQRAHRRPAGAVQRALLRRRPINWWDPKGTRSTLEELKALGLKTFLLPPNPARTTRATSTTTAAPRWMRCGTRSRHPASRSATTSVRPRPRLRARTTASWSA